MNISLHLGSFLHGSGSRSQNDVTHSGQSSHLNAGIKIIPPQACSKTHLQVILDSVSLKTDTSHQRRALSL